MKSEKSNFYCEVLVVGGGLAALSAAISAADNGATVLLINKGITGNSGSSAKAAGILAAAQSSISALAKRILMLRFYRLLKS